MQKLVITAAVTGSLTNKAQNPALPVTPEEIAREAVASCRAGASLVHLHVRDPETGRPVQDADLFAEVIKRIRGECDIIINVSTGGGPGMSFDERIAIIPLLSADPLAKPEMASLNSGSINFGIFSATRKQFVLDSVQLNPWSELQRFGKIMKECGVKPEIEVYEAGMINNALTLEKAEALDRPFHCQFVLGVLGAMQATVENLVFLKNSLPPDSSWSVCVLGPDIFRIGPVAVAMGGHVRLGLEDSVHLVKGRLAAGNAELVAKLRGQAESMGREVASPAEARQILRLA